MRRSEALKELRANINRNFSHAVLLCDSKGSWRTELHSGHAGNCCCDEHKDFVWRETAPYTYPSEIDDITETSQSFSAAALGRKGGSAKSEGEKPGDYGFCTDAARNAYDHGGVWLDTEGK